MYDNPMTHKFYLQELERQARPLIEDADKAPRTWSARPVLGMLVVAGIAGMLATVLTA